MGNEYMRGYSNGQRARDSQVEELKAALREARSRAERAERGLGFGGCFECVHWHKPSPGMRWGFCGLSEKILDIHWPWRGDPEQKIATKENFGCIRFNAKEPTNDPR